MIGADYSTGRPGGAALAAAGVKAVGRYASYGRSDVNITADEVKDLRNHGIDIFIYNEHSAGYMNGGATAAQAYVPGALSVCRAVGLPDGPIFYAVDYDATLGGAPTSATALANMHALAAFLTEAARLSKSWDLVGVYGGFYTVQWLLDNLPDLTHAVQTSAWSAGHWDPRAFARQDGYNWKINGVDCDHLTIVDPNEGSLRYQRGEDMPLTGAEKTEIVNRTADAVWAKMLTSRWHGSPMNAGDLLEFAAWYSIESSYNAKRGATNPAPGTPTFAATLLAAAQAAAKQTDTLEASAAAAPTLAQINSAAAAQVPVLTRAIVDALKGTLPAGQAIDYTHVGQVVGQAVTQALGTLRIVSGTPATPA
jgi:hypothetical protein